MSSCVTDIRHLPPKTATKDLSAGRRRASFTREVVEAATSRATPDAWISAVRCISRVARKLCVGQVSVRQAAEDSVEWICPRCGEQGSVSGFAGGEHDLSKYWARRKMVLWGVDAKERDYLLVETTHSPALRAIISRATPYAEIEGLLLIHATVAELNQLYTLVEELTIFTRSWQRREMLDSLRARLCTSIDGF